MKKETLTIIGVVLGAIVLLGTIAFFGSKNQSAQIQNGNQNLTTYQKTDTDIPKAEAKELNFSFGKIGMDKIQTHSFIIKNIGAKPLELTNIKTSCDCTSAIVQIAGAEDSPEFAMHTTKAWVGSVEPGAEATLLVKYDPKKHPALGTVTRSVYVATNDPNNPSLTFEIQAEVIK